MRWNGSFRTSSWVGTGCRYRQPGGKIHALFELYNDLIDLYGVAGCHSDRLYSSCARSRYVSFHSHGFKNHDQLIFCDDLTWKHVHLDDNACNGAAADFCLVAGHLDGSRGCRCSD